MGQITMNEQSTNNCLNVNSIRNMFNNLEKLIKDNIDVKMIAEAKIDASYPIIQFSLENYHKLLRSDINSKITGILVYVKSSVASLQLKCDILLKPTQNTPFELNLRKEK